MIFVLLPAFNEAENILPLLQNLEREAQEHSTQGIEAVVVNDGSTDATADLVRSFQGSIAVTLLDHPTNRGLGPTLFTGIRTILEKARDEDVVVTLDADGTHHPRYIFDIAERFKGDYDVVVASRYTEGGKEIGVSRLRRMLSHGARCCYRGFYPQWGLKDFSCGYRGIRIGPLRETVKAWGDRLFEAPGFACTGELMLKLLRHTQPGRVTEIPFELHYEQKGGKSKMPPIQTIFGTLRLLWQSRSWNKIGPR